LADFENDIKLRHEKYNQWINTFAGEGGLEGISESYKKFGLILQPNNDIVYREWAPSAQALSLFGDFNEWNREQYHAHKDQFGVFTITLKAKADGTPLISNGQRYKIQITTPEGKKAEKNPAWARFVVQNEQSKLFDGVFFNPDEKYVFKNKRRADKPKSVRIYEAHVGMSSVHGKVSQYREFAEDVLPRIVGAGYNVIQLMAIQEHAYYGSFGYHVTSYFAPSSRQGNPNDLKYLIDKAHGMGLQVIIDIVHSHASNNVNDGINMFDGTDHCYSHAGEKGHHKAWDSMIFDYSKYEVMRFLLSNLAWWLNEYQVDGFRFDAVTSMMYHHHGINFGFTGNYKEYFGLQTDMDGIAFLMLANKITKTLYPNAITIAEDVSGMPTLCRTIEDGGIGFDYRLNMFLPDLWIKTLKEVPDEQWSMGHLTHSMTNRRWKEKCVGYAESHDQAIVGDKTLAQWLFDD